MMECPFCGKQVSKMEDMYEHVWMIHCPGLACFCGHDCWLANTTTKKTFQAHINTMGGLERHIHDYLMGEDACQRKK